MDVSGDSLEATAREKFTVKSSRPPVCTDDSSEPVHSSASTVPNGNLSLDVNGLDKDPAELVSKNGLESNSSEPSACDLEKLNDQLNGHDEDAVNSNSSRNVEAANSDGTNEGQDDADEDGWIYVLGHNQLKKRVSTVIHLLNVSAKELFLHVAVWYVYLLIIVILIWSVLNIGFWLFG
jgi:hypothetical protein